MLIGRFIGINKYHDISVPDLAGAARDARKLWALFADTHPKMDSQLLTDADATAEEMRSAISEALVGAGADDLVVISYSGHGTRDHRLVAHDTDFGDIAGTTIPMSEVAELFRQTKAKAVICILDCCFSGGAPAKVLDGTPASRDLPFTPETFSGAGRVMITAGGLDEEAYESPTSRHGFLSQIFFEVFMAGAEPLRVMVALSEVQDRVRAAVAGLGRKQNPVLFGSVDGGFTLPVLKAGSNHEREFPELRPTPVSSDISSLERLGIPKPILQAWSERYSSGLNSLQLQAVNSHGVLNGKSLLVVAPTSAGKTFVGEMAAVTAILEGRKAVILLPYRALVNEKYEDLSALYGEMLDLRVVRCSGDFLDQTTEFLQGKYDIAVLTFEMFLSLAMGNESLLHRLGLVVLDEAQFIADKHRGIVVELILTYLRSLRTQGIAPQVILLSATIGDVNHFDEWFDLNALSTTERPVPLEIGVLDRGGTLEYLDSNGERATRPLLTPYEVQQRRNKPSSQDVIVPLAHKLLSDEEAKEKLLIFRNTRGKTEGCANYLAEGLGLPSATSALEALPTYDNSTKSAKLQAALRGGAAFHNTNLNREERVVVEQAFRDPDNPVKVLVATTTLAAGVNTPASTVIIVEHEFIGGEVQPFSVAEVRNMAGRAGRLGFRETGKAIILAGNAIERSRLFERYVLGDPEPVSSSFKQADIGTWVLRLLGQVRQIREAEIIAVVANTYGGYLLTRSNPDWQSTTSRDLVNLVPRMVDDGLLERAGEFVQLTTLGQACAGSALSFRSCLRLIEMLNGVATSVLTAKDMLALVQALEEMDGGYTPLFRRGQRERQWEGQIVGEFSPGVSAALRQNVADTWTVPARAKRACIALDWISGVPTGEMEERFTMNPFRGPVGPGDITSIANTTRFLLGSAAEIAQAALLENAPDSEQLDNLLKQLEFGIPSAGLPLLELPVTLPRGQYLELLARGIDTPEKFWSKSEEVQRILGKEMFATVKVLRPED